MQSERATLKLETITPLHITHGAMGEMIPLEYVVDEEGKLHHFDFISFTAALTPHERDNLTRIIEEDLISDICLFIKEAWHQSPERFKHTVLWSMTAGDIEGPYQGMAASPERRFFLKPFIRTANRLFLPGSAIKGAMRTALIAWSLGRASLNKEMTSNPFLFEAHEMQYRKIEESKKTRERIWGNPIVSKDPLKALKISDTNFTTAASCAKKVDHCKSVKKSNDGKEDDPGILDFAECVEPGAVAQTTIALEGRFFDFPGHAGRPFTLQHIFNACRAFTDKVLAHEKNNFFEAIDEGTPGTNISLLYDQLSGLNRQSDCFLLRIGRFGGRNSTSFNLYNKKGEEPQSRSLIRQGGVYMPLGWMKATVVRHSIRDIHP